MSDIYNKKTGIYDFFDGLIFSFQTGDFKPNLNAYKIALKKSGFKARECLLIDDKVENLIPAQKLGMKTILFNVLKDNPKTLIKKIKHYQINIQRSNVLKH